MIHTGVLPGDTQAMAHSWLSCLVFLGFAKRETSSQHSQGCRDFCLLIQMPFMWLVNVNQASPMTSPTVSFTPCPLACLILRSDSRSSCSLIELLKLRHRGWIDEQCYRCYRIPNVGPQDNPRHEDFTHFNGFSPSDPMDPVFAKNPFEGRWVLPPCVSCSSWQKLQLKPLRHPSPKWIKRHGWPWRGQTGKNMYIGKVKITSNRSYKF